MTTEVHFFCRSESQLPNRYSMSAAMFLWANGDYGPMSLWDGNKVSRVANFYGQQVLWSASSMVSKFYGQQFYGQQFYGQQILCSASSMAESNIKALPLPCIREMSVWESVLLGGRRKQVPKRHECCIKPITTFAKVTISVITCTFFMDKTKKGSYFRRRSTLSTTSKKESNHG